MAAAALEAWFPKELMTLILSKLPVKSLLRFKCIQKSWYSLIESPQFIRLHLRSSSSSPQFVFNLRVGDKPIQEEEVFDYKKTYREEPEPFDYTAAEPFDYQKAIEDYQKAIEEVPAEPFDYQKAFEEREDPKHVLSFYSYETLEHLGGINNDDIDIPLSNPHGGFVSLSGSCDGLVCITNHFDDDFYDETDQILICNPATREWRSLFVPSDYFIASVAFGSDPSTPGQYKVVMIGMPQDRCDREVNVYDFRNDSWRETGVVFPAPFCYSPRAVSLNGVFHWYATWDIVTFHMTDEVSGSIPMPDQFALGGCPGVELYVSTKSQQLSLVVFDWDQVEGFEIFVMTEYGVKESWTRLFKIGPLSSNIQVPFAFWEEQQQLLVLYVRQLVSCDLQHQNLLRYFPICWDPYSPFPNTNTLVSYSESLVSVKSMRLE